MSPEILDDLENKLGSNENDRSLAHIIYGCLQMGVSLYAVWGCVRLWMKYQDPRILFLIIYPDWLLTLFVFFGLIGFFIGLAVFRGKQLPRRGYLWLLYLLFVGVAINFIY